MSKRLPVKTLKQPRALGILPNFRAPSLFSLPRYSFPSVGEELLQELSDEGAGGLSLAEDKKNVFIEAALPGLRSADIDVTLDNGILHIRGERKIEEQEEDKKIYRQASSSFSYRVALPPNIDAKIDPKTNYRDGILKLTFNKTKSAQGRKIQVHS